MRTVMFPLVSVLLMLLFLCLSGCGVFRKLSGSTASERPPVTITNSAWAPGDQVPKVKTAAGYVPAPIPNVPLMPTPALEYKTYVGPSD